MRPSLLPPNALPLERALEAATARLADIDAPIARLWDPTTIRIEDLPFLAWALSVDSWDPNWSEAIKRDAVAQSILLHRKKGMRVHAAIADFGQKSSRLRLDIPMTTKFRYRSRHSPVRFSLVISFAYVVTRAIRSSLLTMSFPTARIVMMIAPAAMAMAQMVGVISVVLKTSRSICRRQTNSITYAVR